MTWLALAALASTPNIDAFMSACPRPTRGFIAPTVRGVVTAPALGLVRSVTTAGVELEHCFIENHTPRVVKSVIRNVTRVLVNEGQWVEPGAPVAHARKAEVYVDGLDASQFARSHAQTFVPNDEAVLVVVDVDGHTAVRFEKGMRTGEWNVGQGQGEAVKAARGDLNTPRGLYFVVDRSTGPFSGDFAAYYGGAWVKLNYPNAYDAARGVDAGLISAQQAATIEKAWRARTLTLQRTKLGGGIGFHGWNAPWDGEDGGYGLSWGCVVLHPEEAKDFYRAVPVGAAVVLL